MISNGYNSDFFATDPQEEVLIAAAEEEVEIKLIVKRDAPLESQVYM